MVAKFVIFAALVACACAGVVAPIGGTSVSSRQQDGHGNYAFQYQITDGASTHGRAEAGNPHGVVGSYNLGIIDGRARRVDYVADGAGFRAKVKTNEQGTALSAPASAVIVSPYADNVAVAPAAVAVAPVAAAPIAAIAPYAGVAAPYAGVAAPYAGVAGPYAGVAAPYAGVAAPYAGVAAPYAGVAAPYAVAAAPYGIAAAAPYGVAGAYGAHGAGAYGVAGLGGYGVAGLGAYGAGLGYGKSIHG